MADPLTVVPFAVICLKISTACPSLMYHRVPLDFKPPDVLIGLAHRAVTLFCHAIARARFKETDVFRCTISRS
jgi:hypothetical protein